ncbi:MAG: radical SAM protein [Candidatus Hadarchaeales archaeon]
MSHEVIITSDRSLMSEYGYSIFVGFAACAPKLISDFLYKLFLSPPVGNHNGIAEAAPCGTRKMEAALLEAGIDVVVAHPDHLDNVIDKNTKVVGITTNDPRGLGPASTTFSSLTRKRTFSAIFFEKTVKKIREVAKRRGNTSLKIIAGGPGAWQLADEKILESYGIDCVLVGEGEITGVEIFKKALKGEPLPKIVYGETVPVEKIPSIKHRTISGLVEIARGCGRGCKFCVPNLRIFRCRPIEKIMEEVEVNLREGAHEILLHAEDVLRYGAQGPIPDESKVLELFGKVLEKTSKISISHFAFASVVSKPDLIPKLTQLLDSKTDAKFYSGQVGIETGSPRLMEKHMFGKVLPFKPEQWPEIVIEAHKILADHRWVPCSTLISGLPGETAEDIRKTIELVQNLREYRSLIVPLFFVPLGGLEGGKFFSKEDMLPEHWMLMAECIKHDFKWVDDLAKDYLSDPFQRFFVRQIVFRIFRRVLKKPIKLMEEGIDPTTAG